MFNSIKFIIFFKNWVELVYKCGIIESLQNISCPTKYAIRDNFFLVEQFLCPRILLSKRSCQTSALEFTIEKERGWGLI